MTHIYVFSDESGVFDQINNDTFVYAGIIFTDLQEKNLAERRYRSVETRLRKNAKYKTMPERSRSEAWKSFRSASVPGGCGLHSTWLM